MKVNKVNAARKSPGKCGKCDKVIEKGHPYLWWAEFRGPKHMRCLAPECAPKASDLATGKTADILAAVESAEEAVSEFRKDHDLPVLQSAMESFAASIHEVADAYRESAENIENGFNHETEQSTEFNDKAESLDSVADDVEGLSFEDWEEDTGEKETKEAKETRKSEWAEEQASTAEDAISNIET